MTLESSSAKQPSLEPSIRLKGYGELFVISFVILFLELTCIRCPNIAGVIVGGLSEYLSLMMGFHSLLIIAIGYYVLSACTGSRRLPASPSILPSPGTRNWLRFERRGLA